MTLEASGTMSAGGSTTGASVNLELGLSATATGSANDSAHRTLAGAGASGTSYSGSWFYGKSNRQVVALTISSNVLNYVLATSQVSGYRSGLCDVTLTINSGIEVGSSSTSAAALIVDTSWAAGDTVTIINNGYIVGCGGNGGTGDNGSHSGGSAGSAGGPALQVGRATTIQNNGVIGGGGGGGGGG